MTIHKYTSALPTSASKHPARTYLKFIIQDLEEDEFIEIRGIGKFANSSFDRLFSGLTQAVSAYQRQGLSSFAGVHPRKGRNSGDRNTTRARWLIADLDGKDFDKNWRAGKHRIEELLSELTGGPLEPSIIINSGRGYHLYYVLSESLYFNDPEDATTYENLVSRLALALGGDASVKNPERLLRVPGPPNLKEKPGIPTSIVKWDPNQEHHASDLDDVLPPLESRSYQGEPVELPKELEQNLAECIRALGCETKEKRIDERLQAVLLRTCPVCGAGDHNRKPWKAHVTPLSGRLKCKRATCSANEAEGGTAFAEWSTKYAREAKEAIRSRLGENWPVPPPGAKTVKAEQVQSELHTIINEAITESSEAGRAALIQIPPGAGKTTAALKLMAESSDSYVLFMHSHSDLKEKKLQYESIGGSGASVYVGVSQACHFKESYLNYATPQFWRSHACPSCQEKQSCLAWKNEDSRVLFAPHAAYQTLENREVLNDRILFWDEYLPAVTDVEFDLADVERTTQRCTFTPAEEVKLSLQRGSNVVIDAIKRIHTEYLTETKHKGAQHGITRTGSEVHTLINEAIKFRATGGQTTLPGMDLTTSQKEIIASDQKSILSASRIPQDLIPGCSGEKLREGEFKTGDLIRKDLPKLFSAIAAAGDPDTEKLAGVVSITMKGNPQKPDTTFRLIKINKLAVPEGGSLILMDATGTYTQKTIEASLGHKLIVKALDVESREGSEIHRLWIPTQSAKRRSMVSGYKCTDRGSKHLMRILEQVHRRAKELIDEPLTTSFIGFSQIINSWNAEDGILASYRYGLSEDAEVVKAGYYGKHDRATNRFRTCNVFGCIGQPIPNLGAMESEAYAIRSLADVEITGQDLIRGKVASDLIQSLGRARAEQRTDPVVLWHAGPQPPPQWIEFETLKLERGNQDLKRQVQKVAIELLYEIGVSSPSISLSLLESTLRKYSLYSINKGTIFSMQEIKDLREKPSAWRNICNYWSEVLEKEGAAQVHGGFSIGKLWTFLEPEDAKMLAQEIREQTTEETEELELAQAAGNPYPVVTDIRAFRKSPPLPPPKQRRTRAAELLRFDIGDSS